MTLRDRKVLFVPGNCAQRGSIRPMRKVDPSWDRESVRSFEPRKEPSAATGSILTAEGSRALRGEHFRVVDLGAERRAPRHPRALLGPVETPRLSTFRLVSMFSAGR